MTPSSTEPFQIIRYQALVDECLNEEIDPSGDIFEKVIQSFEVTYDTVVIDNGTRGGAEIQILSKESLIHIQDKRWHFNGVQNLKKLYEKLRF